MESMGLGRWAVGLGVLTMTALLGSAGAVVAQPSPAGVAGVATSEPADAVEGAWRAEEYVIASGPTHPLRGHIMFTGGDWNVLFFVLDADGTPRRMSAEGGTYTLNGEDLVFTHLYLAAKGDPMEGLPESVFEMRALDEGGAEEAATVSVDGDRLTLFFPSGNEMRFARAPRAG